MTQTTDSDAEYLKKVVQQEAMLWGDEVAVQYHAAAAASMNKQWTELIFPLLSKHQIDLSRAVDFACGYGRNALKLRQVGAKHLTLVDVNPDNISYCKKHLGDLGDIDIVQNNGLDLSVLPSNGFSHVYSFDAMVHFDLELVIAYIAEFARVLERDGTALIHHSNFSQSPGSDFRSNPHWRNFMSDGLFSHVAQRHNFSIMEQKIIGWGNVPELDCITVMKRN